MSWPATTTTRDVLEGYGVDCICGWIVDGVTLRDIAKLLGIYPMQVYTWVSEHPEQNKFRAARRASADTLQEAALAVMEDLYEESKDKDFKLTAPMVMLARERAQVRNHMAACRSSEHRATSPVDAAPLALHMPVIIINPVSPEPRYDLPVTIEHENG